MATIPSGQKFHTVPSGVNTQEKGSALANSQREIYTMQDVIDTVEGALPPSAPKIYIAILNQTGTNEPSIGTVYEDFSPNSVVRNGVGVYTLIFDTFVSEKVIATISLDGGSPFPNAGFLGVSVGGGSNNTIFIKTYDTSGVLSDGILSGARLQIQVYE